MDIEDKRYSNRLERQDSIGKITGFFLFRNLINKYNEDKCKNEDDRKNIKKYGKISLVISLIALLISAACLISNLTNVELFGFSYVVMLVLYVLSGVIISLILSLYGFVFGVMQIRLNRKSIGVFGLVLSIFAFLCSLALILFLII